MILEIENKGERRVIASADLFEMAAQGLLRSESKLWVDGVETFCGNVKGIVFGTPQIPPVDQMSSTSPASPAASTTPVPPIPPLASPTYSSTSPAASVECELSDESQRQRARVRTPYLDYMIGGDSTPFLICYLEGGQSVYSSVGGRVWTKGLIETETKAVGGFWKSLGRTATGESFFSSIYRATDSSEIAFAINYPGMIVARELKNGESIICQRRSFLAASIGVNLETFFQSKLRVGFFGGEGFLMQKATGPGVVFLEIAGSAVAYDLAADEKIVCDTGAVAWIDSTCSINVEAVKGLKNIFFGGEGVFNTIITGPGRATLQTMSVSGLAGELAPFFVKSE